MSGKEQIAFDNSLLGQSIEDLEDVAPFAVPPTGEYTLEVQLEPKSMKIKNGKRAGETMHSIEFKYTLVDVVDVKHEEERDEIVPGQMFSELMELTPDRMKWHKQKLIEMKALTGTNNLEELLAAFAKPVKVQAKVTRRQDKQDKDVYYASVSDITSA